MQFYNICPCAASDRLPRLVRRKVAMICAFTVGFRKFLRFFFFFFASRVTTQFNWHSFAQLLAKRFLLWLPMTWWKRYLTLKCFLSILSLTWASGNTFIAWFSQEKPLQWKEINTHTHTHTHTHTYSVIWDNVIFLKAKLFLSISRHLPLCYQDNLLW